MGLHPATGRTAIRPQGWTTCLKMYARQNVNHSLRSLSGSSLFSQTAGTKFLHHDHTSNKHFRRINYNWDRSSKLGRIQIPCNQVRKRVLPDRNPCKIIRGRKNSTISHPKIRLIMAKRKRIITIVAKQWERNPFHELCKLRAKELGISVREASRLIQLQDELAKL